MKLGWELSLAVHHRWYKLWKTCNYSRRCERVPSKKVEIKPGWLKRCELWFQKLRWDLKEPEIPLSPLPSAKMEVISYLEEDGHGALKPDWNFSKMFLWHMKDEVGLKTTFSSKTYKLKNGTPEIENCLTERAEFGSFSLWMIKSGWTSAVCQGTIDYEKQLMKTTVSITVNNLFKKSSRDDIKTARHWL